MAPTEVAPASQIALKRNAGLFLATCLIIANVIGSGIYIVSADIARQVQSPGWLLVVWVITGVLGPALLS